MKAIYWFKLSTRLTASCPANGRLELRALRKVRTWPSTGPDFGPFEFAGRRTALRIAPARQSGFLSGGDERIHEKAPEHSSVSQALSVSILKSPSPSLPREAIQKAPSKIGLVAFRPLSPRRSQHSIAQNSSNFKFRNVQFFQLNSVRNKTLKKVYFSFSFRNRSNDSQFKSQS